MLIAAEGGKAEPQPADNGGSGLLRVTGMDAARVGELAAADRVVLHELTPRLASLEEAYMELTADSSEYGVGAAQVAPPAGGTESASTGPAGTEPAASVSSGTASSTTGSSTTGQDSQ